MSEVIDARRAVGQARDMRYLLLLLVLTACSSATPAPVPPPAPALPAPVADSIRRPALEVLAPLDGSSPVDRFLQGDDTALSAREADGLQLFVGSGCAGCHSGPALGGVDHAPSLRGDRPGLEEKVRRMYPLVPVRDSDLERLVAFLRRT